MDNYKLLIPKKVKKICIVWVIAGLLFTTLFLSFYLAGNSSVTVGHFIIGVFFLAVGSFCLLAASKWKIVVEKRRIVIHYVTKKRRTLFFDDIDYVEFNQEQYVRLFSDNKKVVTIDHNVIHFQRFIEDLKAREITFH